MGKKQTKVVFNAKILKELLPLARPLSFFIPDPHNARSHSPANLKAIANSLKLHGQHRPAVSAPDGRLIIGHGMLEAAKSLGWTHLAVLTTNDTDKEALSRAILDNRTSDLSDFDIPLLKDLLVELDDGLGNLDELTGFTEKELKKLIDWEPHGPGGVNFNRSSLRHESARIKRDLRKIRRQSRFSLLGQSGLSFLLGWVGI